MKKILYFAAVLSAFMTSCNSENEIIDSKPTKVTSTITATFDQPATRVQMGTSDGSNTPLQWNAGDQLAVYNVTSRTFGKYAAASTVANGDLTAVFNFVEQDGTSEIVPEEAHLAAYPYARIAASTFEFRYGTTQAYTANSFDPLAMPMVASNASGTEFSFKAQAAVLRLKVSTTASDVAVNSIEITSASNALTGYAAPNMTLGTYGVPTENTSNTVTLNCATPVAINGTATEFNIVVPGQTYPLGDLTITVKTNKGDFAKTSKGAATFAAGKVYNLNISGAPAPATTGTATATIGGNDVNVGWVQLWAGGPKFADRNVEGTMTFSEATADPFEWGSNWCTPSKDDMDELLKAAKSADSEKVTCTYTEKNGVYGFKFTGKETGYTANSVFFPVQDGDGDYGNACYWSGTANRSRGWYMYLYYYYGEWLYSDWKENQQYNAYLVRPVLK